LAEAERLRQSLLADAGRGDLLKTIIDRVELRSACHRVVPMFLFRTIVRPDGNAQKVCDGTVKRASTECRWISYRRAELR